MRLDFHSEHISEIGVSILCTCDIRGGSRGLRREVTHTHAHTHPELQCKSAHQGNLGFPFHPHHWNRVEHTLHMLLQARIQGRILGPDPQNGFNLHLSKGATIQVQNWGPGLLWKQGDPGFPFYPHNWNRGQYDFKDGFWELPGGITHSCHGVVRCSRSRHLLRSGTELGHRGRSGTGPTEVTSHVSRLTARTISDSAGCVRTGTELRL